MPTLCHIVGVVALKSLPWRFGRDLRLSLNRKNGKQRPCLPEMFRAGSWLSGSLALAVAEIPAEPWSNCKTTSGKGIALRQVNEH
jgi:hypothetical protein